MAMGEKTIFQLSQQQLQSGKNITTKTRMLFIRATTNKIDLAGEVLGKKKCNIKRCIIIKRLQIFFLYLIPDFHNFAL